MLITPTPTPRWCQNWCQMKFGVFHFASESHKNKEKPRQKPWFLWLRRQDSNLRPPGYEPDELPTALLRDMLRPSALQYNTTQPHFCQPFISQNPSSSSDSVLPPPISVRFIAPFPRYTIFVTKGKENFQKVLTSTLSSTNI